MAQAGEGAERVLAAGSRPAAGAGVLVVFGATLLVSARLLFWLEPMFTRMVLPRLGGSPAVWNTAPVFFQAALLAGYGHAHALARWLSPLSTKSSSLKALCARARALAEPARRSASDRRGYAHARTRAGSPESGVM
jgi:hypothetical protein